MRDIPLVGLGSVPGWWSVFTWDGRNRWVTMPNSLGGIVGAFFLPLIRSRRFSSP